MEELTFDDIWSKGTDTKVHNGKGGFVREFKPKQVKDRSYDDMYKLGTYLRKAVLENMGSNYRIAIAVKVKAIGQWRAGKYTQVDDPLLLIWSHDDYFDDEKNNGNSDDEKIYSDYSIFIQ